MQARMLDHQLLVLVLLHLLLLRACVVESLDFSVTTPVFGPEVAETHRQRLQEMEAAAVLDPALKILTKQGYLQG